LKEKSEKEAEVSRLSTELSASQSSLSSLEEKLREEILNREEMAKLVDELQSKISHLEEQSRIAKEELSKKLTELEKERNDIRSSYQSQLENAKRHIDQQTSMLVDARDQIRSFQSDATNRQGDGEEEDEDDYNEEEIYLAYKKGQEKLSQAAKFVAYQEKLLHYKDEQVLFFEKLLEIKEYEIRQLREQLQEFMDLDELAQDLFPTYSKEEGEAEGDRATTEVVVMGAGAGGNRGEAEKEEVEGADFVPFQDSLPGASLFFSSSATDTTSAKKKDVAPVNSFSTPNRPQRAATIAITSMTTTLTPQNDDPAITTSSSTSLAFPRLSSKPQKTSTPFRSIDRRDLLLQLQKKEQEILTLQEHLRISVNNETNYRQSFVRLLEQLNHLSSIFAYCNFDVRLLVEFSTILTEAHHPGGGSRSRRSSLASASNDGGLPNGTSSSSSSSSLSFLSSSSSFLSFHNGILSSEKYEESFRQILEKLYLHYKQTLSRLAEARQTNQLLREENERREKENQELLQELSDGMAPFQIN
jgi:hypothetical protein